MRDGWRQVAFGDIVDLDVVRVPVAAGRAFPVVGVLGFGRGILRREPVTAASTSYRELNLVRGSQLIYSKLKAFEGAITVTPDQLPESFASSEFPTFTCRDAVLPDYLRLVTQQTELWSDLASLSKGLGGRRERLSPRDLLGLRLSLPPLAEQRRIVDLIGALDDAIGAATRALARAQDLRRSAADQLYERWPHLVALREFAPPRDLIGGPFGSSLVSADYVSDGVPVIRGTNMSADGPWVGGDFVYVTPAKADQLSRNQAMPGDVIFTQRGTLGQVSLVPITGAERYVVSQSQMRLRVDEGRDSAKFVYHAFSAPRMVREIQSRNTATANPHINLGLLGQLEIPRPPLADQLEAVALLDAAESVAGGLRDSIRDLSKARGNLLNALLSGEHVIPESYDELFEAV